MIYIYIYISHLVLLILNQYIRYLHISKKFMNQLGGKYNLTFSYKDTRMVVRNNGIIK
jgi:predicted lactoylglutathione lyase